MDCRQCLEDLTAYLDGELNRAHEARIRDHLDRCEPCRRELNELTESTKLVRSHSREFQPVPEIWNNLRSRIAEMPPPEERFHINRLFLLNRWRAAAAVLAACFVLALATWAFLNHLQSERKLQAYMNEYVRQRQAEDRLHQNQEVDRNGTTEPVNPFSEVTPVSFENPFRTGGK